MFLFGRNKIKVRSEESEDGAKTFIEYYGIKQKNVFKVKVLNELIGDNFCLGVLDSRILYSQEELSITFRKLMEYLDSARIAYKKFEIKKIPEVSMFGMTIKKGAKKTDKDYIVGFSANKDNIKEIEEYMNKYNVYYFIDKLGLSEEALLQKLAENYEDVDEMNKDFYCQIFDNNFSGQLVILSESDQATEIKKLVNKCYSDLQ